MSAVGWIVCERACRWAPALRTALERHPLGAGVRVGEVRTFDELTARIEERPSPLALLEVTATNLEEALAWLAQATHGGRITRAVALLDRALACPTNSAALDRRAGEPDDVAGALREAGAIDIVRSPRHLPQLLPLSTPRLHGGAPRFAYGTSPHALQAGPDIRPGDRSLEVWMRARLPWQDAARPVG